MTLPNYELRIPNQQVSGSNSLVGSSSNPEKSGFFPLTRFACE
jgi:hypothetical protein